MRLNRLVATTFLLACAAFAQQPNSGLAAMRIDGIDGPPFPIAMNVRTSTVAVFQLTGWGNANFSIVGSANGNVQPNSATFWDDKCDLPLSPNPAVCVDGVAHSNIFKTDVSGQFVFTVQCPPVGTLPNGIPLNFHAAYQAAMADFGSPHGWSLTAATRVTIIQGPTVVNMNTGIGGFGDSLQVTVNLNPFGMALPFYGVNHTTVHVSGDGYMTFSGVQTPDFTATPTEMNQGPPRIAAFWTDLDQLSPAIVRYTIDPSPTSGPPFMLVEFINVADAGGGGLHTHSWRIDTQGNVAITQATTQNQSSFYDVLIGVGGGQAAGYTQPGNKDLSAMILPNSVIGAVNEAFFEWFGLTPTNVNYTFPVSDPFDLVGRTVNFQPVGAGGLPGATNRYQIY